MAVRKILRWFGASRERLVGVALAAILSGVVLVSGADLLGPVPVVGGVHRPWLADGAAPSVPPSLALTPGAWTMVAGRSVAVEAALSGLSGCSMVGARIVWSLPGYAAVDGVLNASEGPTVTYTTFPGAGGLVSIAASADATIACSGTDYSTSASGAMALTILPSLEVTAVATDRDPALPGSVVDLSGRVSGGLPPYSVAVDFGDGTGATATMDAAGGLSVGHAFESGRFTPSLRVIDATGASATASVPSAELVAYGLAASLIASGSSADVGLPLPLSVSVVGGFPPYSVRWSDSSGATAFGPTWNWTPRATGTANVTVSVVDTASASTFARRAFTVEPLPNLTITARAAAWDTGVPLPVWSNVAGGVAPYSLTLWTNGSLPTEQRATAPGTTEGSVVGKVAGPLWVGATLTDALGAHSSTERPVTRLCSPPALALAVGDARGEVGVAVALDLLETGGAPPVNWSVLASAPVANSSAPVGSLSGPGVVRWSGAFLSPGNATVTVLAVDAAGAAALGNVTWVIAPGLSAAIHVNGSGATAGGRLSLAGVVTGGVPPYAVSLTLSDQEGARANRSSPGALEFVVNPVYPGYLEVHFLVTDALGRSAVGTTTAFVAPSSTPPSAPAGPTTSSPGTSGSTGGWWLGVGALVAIAAVGLVPRVWRRRRARPGPSPESVAMVVVRRILQSSEGLERPTVEFLAEEEGVVAPVVGLALDRWRRAGRLRSEPGPDGIDLLYWTESPPPGERPDTGPGEAEA